MPPCQRRNREALAASRPGKRQFIRGCLQFLTINAKVFVDELFLTHQSEFSLGEGIDRMAEASGLRILLAEDNETSRDIAVITLECKGAAVTAVENGQLCLDSFRNSEHYAFDAVLLDLRMPVMDGLEAARRLRKLKRPDAAAVPIFALTASNQPEDMAACRLAGMDCCLCKPLSVPELLKALRKIGYSDAAVV